jgi:hypothetical protein
MADAEEVDPESHGSEPRRKSEYPRGAVPHAERDENTEGGKCSAEKKPFTGTLLEFP